MQADRYSRLVSWLKVLLPLMALALLSVLFLLSRAIDPGTAIPFAEQDIQDRLRGQQVTGPFFSGTTADGDQITFSADKLTTPQGQIGGNEAQGVLARVKMMDGAEITLQADNASINLGKDSAELTGDVIITTSAGYRVVSDYLVSEMSALSLESPGPVEATGPAGTITAGAMVLDVPASGQPAQLVFTNRVKLVYLPKQLEE